MKYCIGCIHWNIYAHKRGREYSESTADCDTPASLSCGKGHWSEDLDNWAEQSDMQKAVERCMEKAETCPDFSERPPHEANR